MRDPRVEPRAGDVLKNARGDVFNVMGVGTFKVQYRMRAYDSAEFWASTFRVKLADWKAEHRTATIIHAEGE